jgi:hypothetical protein
MSDASVVAAYSTTLAAIAGFFTAIATVVLAYLNREYLKRVDIQADSMNKQTTLMSENMEHDRLLKQYDKRNVVTDRAFVCQKKR